MHWDTSTKPHAHQSPMRMLSPQVQMVMLTPITHACHPMHSLLRMHHASCDMRWAWAMRNAYAQHAKCATCTIRPCMHAMHGIISSAMRNAHGNNILYMMNIGRMGQSAEGRCVCENRRKTREQGLPYSGARAEHFAPKELTNMGFSISFLFSRKTTDR